MSKITGIRTHDLRFPTSVHLDGSDAMNTAPDYSAAYVVLETDGSFEGHGLTFTCGRGTEICVSAIKAMRHLIVGMDMDWIRENPGRFWHHLTADSQLRWIGPDKGAIHMATGAVVNAFWDILARESAKPLWRLIAEMSPTELVNLVDFRYLTDVLTRDEALVLLEKVHEGAAERIAKIEKEGYPCYTTSAGWLGYTDEKLRRLCKKAKKEGFTHIKFKVGANLDDDIRRLKIARKELGRDVNIMIDANQVWEVGEAIEWVKALSFAHPLFIEEPTSPDDIAGHKAIREAVAPIKVASGEMCQNRIMFKQMMASSAIDIVQVDACRIGGLNEVFAVLLMAAKFNLPVWPHAGGVGLCEYVQHLSMLDYAVVSGSREGRRIEFTDHLHEHFVHPCLVRNGAYAAPTEPGFSVEIKAETLNNPDFNFG